MLTQDTVTLSTDVALNSIVGQMLDAGTSWTYDRTTDSLEAVRDRGDAAWTTAAGFSTHSAADVWAVATRALTDKAGFTLSAAGVTAIWAEVIEGTRTAVQMMRGFSSVLLGKLSGAATATNTFRDIDDTKARVTATVDTDGNRSAITLDLT